MTDPRVEAACAAYKATAGRVSRQAMVRALDAADDLGGEAKARGRTPARIRGEFARLLLVLADAERLDRCGAGAWWKTKRHRRRVSAQLCRCLATLGEAE